MARSVAAGHGADHGHANRGRRSSLCPFDLLGQCLPGSDQLIAEFRVCILRSQLLALCNLFFFLSFLSNAEIIPFESNVAARPIIANLADAYGSFTTYLCAIAIVTAGFVLSATSSHLFVFVIAQGLYNVGQTSLFFMQVSCEPLSVKNPYRPYIIDDCRRSEFKFEKSGHCNYSAHDALPNRHFCCCAHRECTVA
jgi:hypothetical protein